MAKTIETLLLISCTAFACGEGFDTSATGLRERDENGERPEIDPDQLPPTAPSAVRLSARSRDSLSLTWTDRASNDVSTEVQRRAVSGNWSTVRNYGTLTGETTYRDAGLSPDSYYCYRVLVRSANRSNTSAERCGVTEALASPGVYRLELRLQVADVEDAGSDDEMSISLNASGLPAYNFTGLNYARDDFERGTNFRYDLSVQGVQRLHDINQIKITKYGSDWLCLREIEILVNGVRAFVRSYGNTRSTCYAFDDGSAQPLSFTHAELRQSPDFTNYVAPFPSLTVPREELESRLESLIGTLIWNSDEVHWGHIYNGRGVEVSYVSPSRIHVDLDLEGAVTGPNPEVDIDFDLDLAFTQGADGWSLGFDTQNFDANVDFVWWAEVLSVLTDPICAPIASAATQSVVVDCISRLEDYIETRVEAGFSAPSQRIPIGNNDLCAVPSISANSDGSLTFGCAAFRTVRPIFRPVTRVLAP